MNENNFEKIETDPFLNEKKELDLKFANAIDEMKKMAQSESSSRDVQDGIKDLKNLKSILGNSFDSLDIFLKDYKEMYKKYADAMKKFNQIPEKESISGFKEEAKNILAKIDIQIEKIKAETTRKIYETIV